MQTESLITLRDRSGATAVIAPDMGGWLLRYSRPVHGLGDVEGLYFSQAVVDRYPNQMYAGNPLLFPMVSFNHEPDAPNHFRWEGALYALPQHGFARRSKWRVVEAGESKLVMELRDTAETLLTYPFNFRTEISYALDGGRLTFRQMVVNTGQRVMPFSTGIHPYLPVPLAGGNSRNSCFVELPKGKLLIPSPDWNEWRSAECAEQEFSVGDDVSGTVFLTSLERPEISLVDPTAGLRIRLNFAEAPLHRFVALWSKSTTEPFYCIEPWTALPNSFHRGTELICLKPAEKFEAAMWLDIEPS